MAASRYVWSDKPVILVEGEMKDGETIEVSCIVPIPYGGGDCRLFREPSDFPFKVLTATSYVCVFNLTSKEVLGNKPVGSRVRLRCDYKLQEYTSVLSDNKGVTVWGTRPSPSLSISHRFVSPDDIIELTCSPPVSPVDTCNFYQSSYYITDGPCSRNVTVRELAKYEKKTLLLPLNLTCTYEPESHRYIISEHSEPQLLFVVDASTVTSPVDCLVSVSEDQLEAFGKQTWTTFCPNGTTVTVQMTNSSLNLQKTCN
ncbi:uncharacterized protein LOC105940202 [Fundulus heteroclitus]|uniref:uncharacterized protein LOC105940202 n=1 Tax=Fundulus heteroclitus TaxID=8078 RepID=UPI00165ACE0B|nr:uncharacterized protein LOC105940202 [Fundulus heteroclitus]